MHSENFGLKVRRPHSPVFFWRIAIGDYGGNQPNARSVFEYIFSFFAWGILSTVALACVGDVIAPWNPKFSFVVRLTPSNFARMFLISFAIGVAPTLVMYAA